MVLIRTPKIWQLSKNEVTAETVYYNRRHFLKGLIGLSIGANLYA
ncbi:hypothetical protein [Aphanothece hegewaldii]|nr:hypothetical protein [Aphanothece hegewaldii]